MTRFYSALLLLAVAGCAARTTAEEQVPLATGEVAPTRLVTPGTNQSPAELSGNLIGNGRDSAEGLLGMAGVTIETTSGRRFDLDIVQTEDGVTSTSLRPADTNTGSVCASEYLSATGSTDITGMLHWCDEQLRARGEQGLWDAPAAPPAPE